MIDNFFLKKINKTMAATTPPDTKKFVDPNGRVCDVGLLVVGGSFSNCSTHFIEAYPKYELLPDEMVDFFPKRRSGYVATVLDNFDLILTGGTTDDMRPTDRVDVYCRKTGTWKKGAPMNVARFGHTATHVPGIHGLYVAGGIGASGELLSSTEIYDCQTGQWAMGPKLPIPRARHVAVLTNGKSTVLIAGGITTSIDGTMLTTNAHTCTLNETYKARYRYTQQLKTPRAYAAACLLDSGHIIISGGIAGEALSSCELFSPKTFIWTETISMIEPRYGHAIASCGSDIIFSGGTAIKHLRTNNVWFYSLETHKWTEEYSLLGSRVFHQMFLYPFYSQTPRQFIY